MEIISYFIGTGLEIACTQFNTQERQQIMPNRE